MQWDAHDDIEENHLRMAAQTDQPMAALLTDLKRRGLLDSTLVVIGGELYSDSMGPPGSAGETYLGMMRENVIRIVHALK